MKTTFKSTEFVKALRDVVRVTPTSTNKQVLKHVLIKVDRDEQRVDIYGSSDDMSLRRTLFQAAADSPVSIQQSGACLLPGKELFEIAKIARGDITLTVGKLGRVEIKCDDDQWELAGIEPEMFTYYGDTEDQDTTTAVIKAPDLHRLLRRTTHAVAKTEVRPVLTGVNLSLADTSMKAIATDAQQLAKCLIPCQSVIGDARSITILGTLLEKLALSLPASDDDEEVTMTVGTSSCTLNWGDDTYRVVMRALAEPFPDVERIIPNASPNTLVIDRQILLNAFNKASIMSVREYQQVMLDVTPEKITVSATASQYGNVRIPVPVKSGNTSDVKILCNIGYWLGLLHAYEGTQDVEIGLNGPNRPFTVTPVGEDGLGLIAPISVRGAAQHEAAS